MDIPQFKIEEFWKNHEFTARHILCPSSAETWSLDEILKMADTESLELWNSQHLGYTEGGGSTLLKEEIRKLYTTIDQGQVFTTAGAEEGIYLSMLSTLSPGDHAIVMTPCYQSLVTLPRQIGADVTALSLHPHNRWSPDIEQLKSALRPTTKLIVINSPHNPTGMLLDKQVFNAIITLARSNGAYILADEVYRYLEIDESKRLPSMADAYERGISINATSKAFGLGSLRVGWIASRDSGFLQKVSRYKTYTTICNSGPSEILALIALRAKDQILKRNRAIILNNLDHLDRFFERHKTSLKWIRPEGGTMAFPELLLPVSVDLFFNRLLNETGVLIMPGSLFDVPGNFFRIGFSRKNMPAVLKHFDEFLTQKANTV